MRLISSIADIEEGVAALVAREPRFETIAQAGLPPLRRSPAGFTTLIEILVGQMISLQAADAIMSRLRAAFEPWNMREIAATAPYRLQNVGLSRAKAMSVIAIAQAVMEGKLDFNELEHLEDGDVQSRLTALRGIGPWTADIYLLTALGRCDVLPSGDVALQSATQLAFDLAARPGRQKMQQLGEAWRPWRSVAARLLWTHYRRVRAAKHG
jgi:DNA-3-methyladenine glycosylase II